MTKSYEEMLHLAILKMRNAKRHQEIADTQPDNEDARYFAIREAIAGNVLCGAIAYMFDRDEDAVYWEAFDAAEAMTAGEEGEQHD